MKNYSSGLICLFALSGCVVVPTPDETVQNRCEISTDHKTLKIVNGFEQTNTFYSISGIALIPITGIVSGTYVAVNNIYRLGEQRIVCGPQQSA